MGEWEINCSLLTWSVPISWTTATDIETHAECWWNHFTFSPFFSEVWDSKLESEDQVPKVWSMRLNNRVHNLWFMVYVLWFMVYGLWFMVYVLCFMGYGLGVIVEGLKFEVWCFFICIYSSHQIPLPRVVSFVGRWHKSARECGEARFGSRHSTPGTAQGEEIDERNEEWDSLPLPRFSFLSLVDSNFDSGVGDVRHGCVDSNRKCWVESIEKENFSTRMQ